ncbi:hypothetical protein DSECCO2_304800 [anaerobic digester metagenome]
MLPDLLFSVGAQSQEERGRCPGIHQPGEGVDGRTSDQVIGVLEGPEEGLDRIRAESAEDLDRDQTDRRVVTLESFLQGGEEFGRG